MKKRNIFAISLCLFTAVDVTLFVYYLLSRRKRRSIISKNTLWDSLFFPDSHLFCERHHFSLNGCQEVKCSFSHEETSLSRLLAFIYSAKKSISVAIYVLTCTEFSDALINALGRHVKVRIITDHSEVNATNNQYHHLMSSGISVRTNTPNYMLMHHKFAVIDDEIVATGSFNWTRTAVLGNCENVIVTSDKSVVNSYVKQFEKLWNEFAPFNE